MLPSKLSPNLAPEQSFEELALLPKLTAFFKVWGRLIVLLSQLLVVTSFLWMCFLDIKLNNLNKTLETKIATVKAASATKEKLLDVQKKLAVYNQVKADKTSSTVTLTALEQATPREVTLQRISLTKNGLDISATTGNGVAFGKLLYGLKSQAAFKEIGLKTATWDERNQSFTISLTITL